jgi:hypothetical protein
MISDATFQSLAPFIQSMIAKSSGIWPSRREIIDARVRLLLNQCRTLADLKNGQVLLYLTIVIFVPLPSKKCGLEGQ